MNALETKFTRLYHNAIKSGNCERVAICTIRWNDDKSYQKGMMFTWGGNDEDNDNVFFHTLTPSELMSYLANIDFTIDEFQSSLDFYSEVDKFDTDDDTNEDWTYLHRGEDFCIVDVEDVY